MHTGATHSVLLNPELPQLPKVRSRRLTAYGGCPAWKKPQPDYRIVRSVGALLSIGVEKGVGERRDSLYKVSDDGGSGSPAICCPAPGRDRVRTAPELPGPCSLNDVVEIGTLGANQQHSYSIQEFGKCYGELVGDELEQAESRVPLPCFHIRNVASADP